MDGGKIKRILFGGPRRPVERKEMTRGQQTAWIIGALIVVTLLGLNYAKTHDASDPYARCHGIFASGTTECEASVAMQRLGRQ